MVEEVDGVMVTCPRLINRESVRAKGRKTLWPMSPLYSVSSVILTTRPSMTQTRSLTC